MQKLRLSLFGLTTAFLMILLTACGSTISDTVPTADLLGQALSLFDAPSVERYESTAAEDTEAYLDPGYAGQLFWEEYDKPLAAADRIRSFSLAVPTGLYAFEIDIFQVTEESAASAVADMLSVRIAAKQAKKAEISHYLKEEAKNELACLEDAEVYTVGTYVMLLATTDNQAVKAAFAEALGADVPDPAKTPAMESVTAVLPETEAETEAPAEIRYEDQREEAEKAGFTLSFHSNSAPDRIVLGGKCAEGASIRVRGGLEEQVFQSDGGNWMCEVEIPKETTELCLTQKVGDEPESPMILTKGQYKPAYDLSSHGVCQVFIGDQSQGHFFGQLEDLLGTNLLTEEQCASVRDSIAKKVEFLNSCGTELVYLIVPNPGAIYPETVPGRYPPSEKDTTRTAQFEAAAREAGATVIDLYEILSEHAQDSHKIFHKTDSHWTDYGAYWGYTALMQKIAEAFPDASPLPIENNFRFYEKEVHAGDMMTHLEIANDLYYENATFCEWLTEPVRNPALYRPDSNELDFGPVQGKKTVRQIRTEKELPHAMIVRDSFSANIYGYLNQAFSRVDWNPLWDYSFKKADIKKAKPDYYIIIAAERNIGNFLY